MKVVLWCGACLLRKDKWSNCRVFFPEPSSSLSANVSETQNRGRWLWLSCKRLSAGVGESLAPRGCSGSGRSRLSLHRGCWSDGEAWKCRKFSVWIKRRCPRIRWRVLNVSAASSDWSDWILSFVLLKNFSRKRAKRGFLLHLQAAFNCPPTSPPQHPSWALRWYPV